MKIFSAEQLKEADKVTTEIEDISSLDLMERAAAGAYERLVGFWHNPSTPLKIFCGIGNNGGDGLVIARKLIEHGYYVEIYIVQYSENTSSDFDKNLERLRDLKETKVNVTFLKEGDEFPKIKKRDVLVDAIFGIGLNRPLPEWISELVRRINNTANFVAAIDMPTGLYADRAPEKGQTIMYADVTLTFQRPKLVFYLPKTIEYVGRMEVIDISLDKNFLANTKTEVELVERKEVSAFHKTRPKFTHKGNFGHCFLSGGSYGKMGSITLASRAVMRSGAGKLTTYIPKCGYEIMQITFPEAMTVTTTEENYLSNFKIPDFEPDVICFGMGAGTTEETAVFFKALLNFAKKPMLIDADGLNLLAKHEELLDLIPENSVLTPHPKELERLIGAWETDFHKLEKAREFAKKHKVIVVMKDAYTLTIANERTYINTSGNPGMATAGSGDVLSGVIAGMLAQGYSPEAAAVSGVFLHGKAGDFALDKNYYEGLISGDLIDNIGEAFRFLKRSDKGIHFK